MNQESVVKLLNLVKRNYNQIAASFDATRKKEIWPQIREYTSLVKDGDLVLDAGCGNGRLLEALQNKNIEYLGFDNSEELIKTAQQNYPQREFLVADILDLHGVPETKFNYIFCLAVLQHIPSRELRVKFLGNLADKLKSGGYLIISSWNLDRIPKYRRLIIRNYWLKLIGKYDYEARDLVFPWKDPSGLAVSDRYYHAFTLRELTGLARGSGLKILEAKDDKYNFWLKLSR